MPEKKNDPEDMSSVPENMMVSCPKASGGMISVRPTCLGCEHHQGVLVMNPSEQIPWEARHQVLCTFRRRISILPKVD